MDKKLFCIRDMYADYTRYIWLTRDDFYDKDFFDNGESTDDDIYSKHNRVSRILTNVTLENYRIDYCLYIEYIPDRTIKDIIKTKNYSIKQHQEYIKMIKNDIKILKGKEV